MTVTACGVSRRGEWKLGYGSHRTGGVGLGAFGGCAQLLLPADFGGPQFQRGGGRLRLGGEGRVR
jgi:hypothetical protein